MTAPGNLSRRLARAEAAARRLLAEGEDMPPVILDWRDVVEAAKAAETSPRSQAISAAIADGETAALDALLGPDRPTRAGLAGRLDQLVTAARATLRDCCARNAERAGDT